MDDYAHGKRALLRKSFACHVAHSVPPVFLGVPELMDLPLADSLWSQRYNCSEERVVKSLVGWRKRFEEELGFAVS